MNQLKNIGIHTLDNYVQVTTVADEKNQVLRYILYFLERERPTFEVRNMLSELLLNDALMQKAVVVNDSKFYNKLITIKRDCVSFSDDWDLSMTLQQYMNSAESIYLYMLSFDQEEGASDPTPIAIRKTEDVSFGSNPVNRKKEREKRTWAQYYQQRQSVIADILLDEYINQLNIYEITKDTKHKDYAERILHLIGESSK